MIRPLNSGCSSRKRSKARKPRRMFFDEVEAVDAHDQVLAAALEQLALGARHARRAHGVLEHLGVDRDRVGAHPHRAVVEQHRVLVEVDRDVEHVDAALQEVVDVVLACERRPCRWPAGSRRSARGCRAAAPASSRTAARGCARTAAGRRAGRPRARRAPPRTGGSRARSRHARRRRRRARRRWPRRTARLTGR